MEPIYVPQAWNHFKIQTLKGAVKSKISRGYVKVDGIGETLLFAPNKIEQKWAENWGVQYNSLKNDFSTTLADQKSPAKLATGYVKEQSTNQIRQGATCRLIGTRRFRKREIKIYEQAMPSSNQQRLCTRIKPRVIRRQSLHFLIVMTERMYILILGRPTSPVELRSCVEVANFAGILCFQNMRNLHV